MRLSESDFCTSWMQMPNEFRLFNACLCLVQNAPKYFVSFDVDSRTHWEDRDIVFHSSKRMRILTYPEIRALSSSQWEAIYPVFKMYERRRLCLPSDFGHCSLLILRATIWARYRPSHWAASVSSLCLRPKCICSRICIFNLEKRNNERQRKNHKTQTPTRLLSALRSFALKNNEIRKFI